MGWVNIRNWRYNSRINSIREKSPEILENASSYLEEFRKYTRYLRIYNPKELKKIKNNPEYLDLIELVNKIESDK